MYPFSQFSRLQANLKSVRRRRLYVPTLWANEMAKEITPASREDRPTCHTCFFTQTGPEHSVPVQRWPLPPSQGCQAQWTDTCTPAHTDTGSESSLPCAQTADPGDPSFSGIPATTTVCHWTSAAASSPYGWAVSPVF